MANCNCLWLLFTICYLVVAGKWRANNKLAYKVQKTDLNLALALFQPAELDGQLVLNLAKEQDMLVGPRRVFPREEEGRTSLASSGSFSWFRVLCARARWSLVGPPRAPFGTLPLEPPLKPPSEPPSKPLLWSSTRP